MQDLPTLFQYIKDNYNNFEKIEYNEAEMIIIFHNDFKMKICMKDYFNLYFNNIFYYNVDWQDIKDTIDDLFSNEYVFCEKNKKLKIIKKKDFHENLTYNHIWTIENTLK